MLPREQFPAKAMTKFRVIIASMPHRENLVVEIFYEDIQWVEINQELSDEMIIQFYPHPRQNHWEFPLEEALTALSEAKQSLLDMGSTRRVVWNLQSSERAYARGDVNWSTTEIVACKAKPNYILWVRFDDGVEGEVDLSSKVGQGVFKAWESEEFWQSARVDPVYGTVCWGSKGEIDLDPYIIKEEILGLKNPTDLSNSTEE